jgi:hypothetical protein
LNPVIRKIDVPVFFTDCFDLGKEYDSTSETIKQILSLSKVNKLYQTDLMKACLCQDWLEKRNHLWTLQTKMFEKITNLLGIDEFE